MSEDFVLLAFDILHSYMYAVKSEISQRERLGQVQFVKDRQEYHNRKIAEYFKAIEDHAGMTREQLAHLETERDRSDE